MCALWVPSVREYVGGVLVVFGAFVKCLFDRIVGLLVVVGWLVAKAVGGSVECICK